MTREDWIASVAEVAAAWQDPDYEPREEAVQATLEADNRYTEEGLAFALNHCMHRLKAENLRAWIGDQEASEPLNVGIVCAEAPPLDGLVAAIAALVLGHRVWVAPSEASPALVPWFFDDLQYDHADEPVRFDSPEAVFEQAEVLVASGPGEWVDEVEQEADAAGIPSESRWLYRYGTVVAVIDGREDAETRSGLAEDVLLHEGVGPRTASVLWAPAALDPDALLDALAGFRELYPAHPATNGTLAMPAAFLASAKQAHATGPGFLVSKGEPEPQTAGHLRWVPYDDLSEVTGWLRTQHVEFVVAAPPVAKQLRTDAPFVVPGDAHRPTLADEAPGLVGFLSAR
jgi:hypothetical protein